MYPPICQTNLVIALHALSLLFWHFKHTTAHHWTDASLHVLRIKSSNAEPWLFQLCILSYYQQLFFLIKTNRAPDSFGNVLRPCFVILEGRQILRMIGNRFRISFRQLKMKPSRKWRRLGHVWKLAPNLNSIFLLKLKKIVRC